MHLVSNKKDNIALVWTSANQQVGSSDIIQNRHGQMRHIVPIVMLYPNEDYMSKKGNTQVTY